MKTEDPLHITTEEHDKISKFIIQESKKQSFFRRQYNKYLGIKYKLQDFFRNLID